MSLKTKLFCFLVLTPVLAIGYFLFLVSSTFVATQTAGIFENQIQLLNSVHLLLSKIDSRDLGTSTKHIFDQEGLRLELRGLDELRAMSTSVHAARKRGLSHARRLTLVADPELAITLSREIVHMGATGFTETPGLSRTLPAVERVASTAMASA